MIYTADELEKLNDWDKWPHTSILYSGRTPKDSTNYSGASQMKLDVRTMLCSDDDLLKQYISENHLKQRSKKYPKLDCDLTAQRIHYFLAKGRLKDGTKALTYTPDSTQFRSYDHWLFPFETIYTKKGDCEDGAILMAALLLNCGIPSFRVKVAVGDVSNRFVVNPDAPTFDRVPLGRYKYEGLSEGGHCYVLYLASDNRWRILDWCYFEDTKVPMLLKPLAKDGGTNRCYYGLWFTFNNKYAWSQTSLTVNSLNQSEKAT